MSRPYIVTNPVAFLPSWKHARQKVHNRDAIATARRIARQNNDFLFAILARPLPFR
jgi:hypothetical protein